MPVFCSRSGRFQEHLLPGFAFIRPDIPRNGAAGVWNHFQIQRRIGGRLGTHPRLRSNRRQDHPGFFAGVPVAASGLRVQSNRTPREEILPAGPGRVIEPGKDV